jgi:hypothetical protein
MGRCYGVPSPGYPAWAALEVTDRTQAKATV